jgi:uncharacterized protein YjiS (DUF1127 family)
VFQTQDCPKGAEQAAGNSSGGSQENYAMSHIAHHPIFALSGQLVARALRVFKNRHQMGKLSELSDAALKDIGLTRSDVRRAIALPVHTDPVPFLTQMANGHSIAALQPMPRAANEGPKAPSLTIIPALPRPEVAA